MIKLWKNNRQKAIVYLVLAALLWSTGGLFIKLIPLHPLAIAGARSLIASIVLVVSFRPKKLTLPKDSWIAALFYALMVIFFVSATKLTTATNAIILQYTAPVFVALLGWFIVKEKASREDWISIIAVFCGLTLFFSEGLSLGNFLGNIFGILSGLSFAFFALFMRKQKDGSPYISVIAGNILTFLFGMPFYFDQLPNIYGFLSLLFLGVFQLGLSYVLYSIAIKHISALETTLITMIEPLLNPVWVFLLVGEVPSLLSLIGGIIILSSIVGKYLIQNYNSVYNAYNHSDEKH